MAESICCRLNSTHSLSRQLAHSNQLPLLMLYFCFVSFACIWVPYHSSDLAAHHLVRVSVQRYFQLPKSSCLNLICILQLLYPLCLLLLQARHLSLDLHALFILFVNSSYKLGALLLTLHVFLHAAHLSALVFLVPDHLLHWLRLQLLSAFLDRYHFFVLGPLLLESLRLSEVLFGLSHLLVSDGFLLRLAEVRVFLCQLSLFLFSLLLEAHFFVQMLVVTLTYIYYIICFVLGLLNFFPSLRSS